MAAEQIIVRVAPDGTVSAETKGITGPKCLDSIAVLEDLLEAQTVASEFTAEYDQTTTRTTIEYEVDDDLRQH